MILIGGGVVDVVGAVVGTGSGGACGGGASAIAMVPAIASSAAVEPPLSRMRATGAFDGRRRAVLGAVDSRGAFA
jgi:hypothetical protein